jgi:DNA-binding GntR family transcriptional regulator
MAAINTPTYLRLREQIRSDIVDGIWKLGAHVTLAELSSHYEVSANPVREALLQLQGEGMVDTRMNRGAVIPAVDARYIDNLYQLRGAIQVALCREAAMRASAADKAQIRALLEANERAAASGDVASAVRSNRDLHHFIDSLADNPLALDVLKSRSGLVDAFRRAHGYGAGRLDAVVAQHRELVEAILGGDADAAGRVALEHTESSRLDLLNLLPQAQTQTQARTAH